MHSVWPASYEEICNDIRNADSIGDFKNILCGIFDIPSALLEIRKEVEEAVRHIREKKTPYSAIDLYEITAAYNKARNFIKDIGDNSYRQKLLDLFESDPEFEEMFRLADSKFPKDLEEELKDMGKSFISSEKDFIDGSIKDVPPSFFEYKDSLFKYYISLNRLHSSSERNARKEHVDKLEEDINNNKDKIDEIADNLHKKVLLKLKEQSPISESEALEWADKNIYLDDIKRDLKKIGYNPDDLRRDIAEFYQITGGKLGPIVFTSSGRKNRAYANGRFTIAIDKKFTKTTLFHEAGHLVEHWNEVAKRACQAFLKIRAEDHPKRLKELTGCRYGDRETAYPDKFFDPYVGKIYSDATEVLSMGMQNLANPRDLLNFCKNDPDHFELTLGACILQNEKVRMEAKRSEEDIREHAEKNADKKALSKEWKRELKKVVGEEFFAKLYNPDLRVVEGQRSDGYNGVAISQGLYKEKYGVYFFDESDGSWVAIVIKKFLFDTKSNCLELAYILLNRIKYGSPLSLESARKMCASVRDATAPSWYEGGSLPEV